MPVKLIVTTGMSSMRRILDAETMGAEVACLAKESTGVIMTTKNTEETGLQVKINSLANLRNADGNLDPKYDCLREKCESNWHDHPHGNENTGCTHREACPGHTTLPADRAHQAVGKLLAAVYQINRKVDLICNSKGQWGLLQKEDPFFFNNWHNTPEESLMAALCVVEGVRYD